jgi:hypothetical protein
MKKMAFSIIIPLMLFSCRSNRIVVPAAFAQAPVIVYKTSSNYLNKVPIGLNEAGDQVSSYPAPSDLRSGEGLALPVQLKKGYLLDMRGVQPNSAFTSYTYEEYAALNAAPPPGELLDKVIDPDPFTEMYHCGNHGAYTDLKKELNRLISDDFPACTNLLKN